MNAQIVPIHRKESLREEGMLFVRTEGILERMIKAPLIVAGLIVVALSMPIQSSFSSTRSLDLIIYSDGSTHISAEMDADPLSPDFEINLFGPSVDNFVATGENGFLLTADISGSSAIIDTLGSSVISVEYDTHDLISKEGRVWTFAFDAPSSYSLLLPENSVIVGMSVLPNNMEIINDQTRLELSSGMSEINYIFGAPTTTPIPIPTENSFDVFTTAIIAGPIVAGAAGGAILLKRKQSKQADVVKSETVTPQKSTTDTEQIFSLRPDMRDDDKEIVKFISENGGEVLESDLRKKFLQPRTTMWRAVKRLERLGVVEITKKDTQNLVKLKDNLEEENE